MTTITLGFESDITIQKSEIAQTQLVEAISLFLTGKFLCSITLAGAAEAVFAGLLSHHEKPSVVERSIDSIQNIRDQTGLSVMRDRKANEIFNEWNSVRNKLKHHRKGESSVVTLNLFDEAYWMIKRGLVNAQSLNVPISNENDFENWIVENINM